MSFSTSNKVNNDIVPIDEIDTDESEYYSMDSDMDLDENSLVSDATYSTASAQTLKKFSNEDMGFINNLLDINEKISLIYLLYNNPCVALQQIDILLKNSTVNIVDEWYKARQNNWQEKLFEALAIIQNYEALRKLGFKKQDMILKFLPMHNVSTYVEIVRKQCYRVCENFDSISTKQFLKYIEQDFFSKKLKHLPANKSYCIDYLEMYFLYLETEGYITLDDIQHLPKIFKYMDLENLHDDFQSLSDKLINKIDTIPVDNEDYKIDKTPGHTKTLNIPNSKVSVRNFNKYTSDVYNIDPDKPGLLLIINNEYFFTEFKDKYQDKLPPTTSSKLENRKGSEADERRLQEIFTRLGFKIISEKNKSHYDMLITIKNVVKDFKYSSLFVAILSHGDKGVVYGANSIPIDTTKIQKLMCQKSLRGIPKVLLLQSCQGSECQKLVDDDDEDYALDGPDKEYTPPKTTDLLTFRATIAGYGAVRHKKDGTWFIQTLCDTMEEFPEVHFEEVCTKVTQSVSLKEWDGKCMVPTKESTFTKNLYYKIKKK